MNNIINNKNNNNNDQIMENMVNSGFITSFIT